MTKVLKRSLSILLAALMIVSLFTIVPFSASAAGETPIGSIEMLQPDTDFNDIVDTDLYRNYRDLLENHQDVITRIYNGIVNREEEINIYEYFIPASYKLALGWIISDSFPEINYKYSLGSSTTTNGFIYKFKFGYPDDSAELLKNFKKSAAEKYLSLVDDSMDDFTKAVILHDAIILNTYYPDIPVEGRGDNYTYMTDGWGVCEHYSEAYAYLLAQCGIKSELVTSTALNHQWLKVKLDGKYYQVDPTWDDFSPEIYGRLRHYYFLWSDDAFPEHHSYSSMHAADSTKHDNYNQLHNIYTQLCYINGEFYAITNNNIVRYDYTNDSVTPLKSLSDLVWPTNNQTNFSTLACYNNKLYYNSATKIYQYDPATGETVEFATGERNYISNFRIVNDQMWVVYADTPNYQHRPPAPDYLCDMPSLPYKVNCANSAHGSVSVDNNTVYAGDTVTLNVSPDTHYKVSRVYVSNVEIEPDNGVYSFVMPHANVKVFAEFVYDNTSVPHTITIDNSYSHGSVTVDNDSVYADETVTLNVTTDAGYKVNWIKVNNETLEPDNGVYSFTMPAEDVTITAEFVVDVAYYFGDGDGSENNPYVINNATGWNFFCDCIDGVQSGWNRFEGKYIELGADLGTAQNPITRTAGKENCFFSGMFNGKGHTVYFSSGTAESPSTAEGTALFSYMLGGYDGQVTTEIKNLNVVCDINTSAANAGGLLGKGWGKVVLKNCSVSGTINTSNQYAGGLVGTANNSNYSIKNCRSSVTINSSFSGGAAHGGLIGTTNDGPGGVTIEGCIFDGKLLTTNGSAYCGGLVGNIASWLSITNSIYAPAQAANGETWVGTQGSCTFARGAATVTNCYYTKTLGSAQGKQAREINAGEYVTLGFSGDATEYSVSGITAYADNQGLLYNNKYYAGSGDSVALTLSHSDRENLTFSNYYVNAGTLSGSTLTMPNEDVTINAKYKTAEYSITFKNEDGTVLQSSDFDYGSTPTYNGETPTKASTAQYSYTFSGWSPEISEVTGDAEYTAQYSKQKRSYSINIGTYDHGTVTADNASVWGKTVALTVNPDPGYKTKSIKVNNETLEPVNGVYSFTMPAERVNITAEFVVDIVYYLGSGDGSQEHPYVLSNAAGWNFFCDCIEGVQSGNWNRFEGKYIELGADIGTAQNPVTRTAGKENCFFSGMFNGKGYTIYFSSGTSETPSTVEGTALFNYVLGGWDGQVITEIRNLNVVCDINTSAVNAGGLIGRGWGKVILENCSVSGTITTSNQYAGGLVGTANNSNYTIKNCRSSVTLISTCGGGAANGGFIGNTQYGPGGVTIEGCIFDGKLLTTNGTSHCGGFVGNVGSGLTITNSIYAPSAASDDETWINTQGGCTFARGGVTLNNCYYTQTLGEAQGKQAYKITAGDYVTLGFSGDATEYSVSGITAYAGNQGLLYNDKCYAGSGDSVALALTHGNKEGYDFSAYSVNAGVLSESTLTMPAQNVTVSASFEAQVKTIIYKYNVYNESTEQKVEKTLTKTVNTDGKTTELLVALNKPYISSPYYTYGECTYTESGNTITATIPETDKKYTVTLNGEEVGKYSYLESATVGTGEQKSFLVDGKVVYVGGQYSFYVCSDTDITTDNPKDMAEYAFINLNNVSITDDKVELDMLATANVEKGTFSRMGVAFALSEKSEDEIKAAVQNVETGTAVSNKIGVHNSSVTMYNQSGQYQFRYAPYFSKDKAVDRTLYFYTYVVEKDGDVKVSDAAQYNMSNLLA